MSLLSGIGNFLRTITGQNDDEQKKKKQQKTVMPKATVINPAQNQIAAASQAQMPELSDTPLQKVTKSLGGAQKPPEVLTKVQPNNPLGPNAPTGDTNWKAVGAEVPLSLAKVATDTVASFPQLYDLITPGKGKNRATQALEKVSKKIDTKAAAVAATDTSGNAADSYQMFQVPAQAASLLTPSGPVKIAKGASKAGKAWDAVANSDPASLIRDIPTAAKKVASITAPVVENVKGFFNDIPVLSKAVQDGAISAADADQATKIAPGIHTVNATEAPLKKAPVVSQTGVSDLGDITPQQKGMFTRLAKEDVSAASPVKAPDLVPPPVPVAPAVPEVVPAPAPAAPTVVKPVTPKPATATAPNAPGIRKAAQKKLDSLAGEAGDITTHDVISNKDLLDAGRAHTDTFNDTALVKEYRNGFTPRGAADIAKGHAALERLNEIAKTGNKDAAKAIDSILEGSEKEFSAGGRTVNYAQQFYDGLKGPAKTSYLVRQIDKIREKAGLPLLRDDEVANLAVTQKIEAFVAQEEKNKAAVAALEKRLDEIKDHARPENGGGSKELTKEANDINKAIKEHDLAQSKNTAELARYYDEVAPRDIALQTKFGDLGRSLMLSSAAGRINDVLTTGINSGHQLLQQTIEAAAGKLTKKPGAVIDTLPSPSAVARGVKYGVQKSKARFKGDIAAGDASSLLKKVDTTTGKGQLLSSNKGFTGKVRKIVRSATELATDLSEGMKESRIQQLAAQQGKKLGLQGEDLKTFTAAQTAAPTRQMKAAGERLQEEVNNMHDNPISEALGTFSNGLAKFPVVGEQMKNLILPFTRWTGGQLHNALIDKNAAVNVGQIIKAVAKGDKQGAITAASKFAVNGVGAITAGYVLAKSGLLTHENAQGYNDDGIYLHLGDRYIPIGFLGFFAPGIILGASTHDAMQKNGDGKGNVLTTAVDTTKNVLKSSFLAYSGESLTGQSNPTVQAFQNSKETGYSGIPPVVAGQVAGQYIPAFLNDINAGLNNGVGVGPVKTPSYKNPTHEAPLTKVTSRNPETGKEKKNIAKTAGNQLLAKIPFVSQELPRKEGVAAPDGIDRITRGSRDTETTKKNRADEKARVETSADLKKRGVPDPNAEYPKGDSFDNAVENRVENKKYDQAIEGLQAKLDLVNSQPNPTEKETKKIETKIKQIQVLKDGNYEPDVRDLYTKTKVEEWRNMGDPESDDYDPDTYQLLYNFDKDLAAVGASSSTKSANDQKFYAKEASKKKGGGTDKSITSNILGSTPSLASIIDISDLTPRKISDPNTKIPTIQQIRPGQLIKKRAISVR